MTSAARLHGPWVAEIEGAVDAVYKGIASHGVLGLGRASQLATSRVPAPVS